MGFLRNIFGAGEASVGQGTAKALPYPRITRRSTGFNEFAKAVMRPEGQTILDLGPTSPDNISFITGLGHRAYNEDVLAAASDPTLEIPSEEEGKKAYDIERFLEENLTHDKESFDAVMLWDICDYLPEPLVKPVIERLYSITKPNGMLLAFFHTKDAGPEAPYYRYHMKAQDTLELQRGPQFRLQRVFANRHVENLFKDFRNIKFFLGKENIREVLIVR